MIDDIKKDSTDRMTKSIESLKQELTKLRTGRAHASLLDHLTVSYYGNDTPLNQVASVGCPIAHPTGNALGKELGRTPLKRRL